MCIPLLACRVPNLHGDPLLIYDDVFCQEISADCRFVSEVLSQVGYYFEKKIPLTTVERQNFLSNIVNPGAKIGPISKIFPPFPPIHSVGSRPRAECSD